MKRMFWVIAIIFSLAILPAIDAVACEMIHSEQADSSSDKSPVENKCDKAAPHCCCHHQIADKSIFSFEKTSILVSAKLPMLNQNPYASVVVGPLLEPPSHI